MIKQLVFVLVLASFGTGAFADTLEQRPTPSTIIHGETTESKQQQGDMPHERATW